MNATTTLEWARLSDGHGTRRAMIRPIAGACALWALLSACAVGPDFKRPDAPAPNTFTAKPLAATLEAQGPHGATQSFVLGQDIRYDWWTLFRSPQLDALIKRAFQRNPSIEAARASLKQAQELVEAQRGFFYPTVGLQYTPTRQKLAGNDGGNSPGVQGNGTVISTYQNPNGPPPYNGPVIYNFHTAQLTVSYAPDVFGGNRRQVESLQAQAELQRFELEAAYLSLAANVVGAAIQEASLRAQIAATERIISAQTDSLKILEAQLRLGYVMDADVATQQAALGQAQQLLPPLHKALDQTRDLLCALVGNLPSDDVAETFDLDQLQLPNELPLTVPSRLVEQRPDVRAAEEQLHGATADVGVAIAARLPQFAISGAIGGEASVFSQMFSSGGPFWNLSGSVAQTLFDGNTLLHRERAADQALVLAAAEYRGTVVGAFQNVADALYALSADADYLTATERTETAAQKALQIVTAQNKLGYVDFLSLFVAEQTYQQAVLNRIQAQANRLGDSAALFQALGGGWWNRPADEAIGFNDR